MVGGSTPRAPRLLRGEQLEPRTVLAALSPMSYPHVLALPPGGQTGLDAKTPTATPPTVTKPATAGVNSSGYVTGKTTTLSVLGNDGQGASALIYNWTVTSTPAGGSAKFSVNGTNAAQNDTVTFSEAGVYGLKVTIVDPSGLSVASSLNVTVVPALTSISLYSGANVLVNSNSLLDVTGTSQTLRAVALDQFGNQLATQPSFSWSPTLYPAGAKPSLAGSGNTETLTFGKAGSYGVSVSASGNGGQAATSAAILVLAEPTYIAVNQVGGSAVVSGTSAQFTVSQFQDQFHNLMSTTTTLSWTATTLPGGAAVPKFAVSGSTTTVNFSAAGTYVLAAKETDASHDVVSQAVTVTVKQTLTSIVVTPGTASIQSGATQQFNAQGLDQFQRAMTTQPTFAWSASGGKIGSTGLFTAPSTAGTYNVAAGCPLAGGGSVAGGAKVTVAAPSPSPAPIRAESRPWRAERPCSGSPRAETRRRRLAQPRGHDPDPDQRGDQRYGERHGPVRPEDDPCRRRPIQHAELRPGPGRRRGQRQPGQCPVPGRRPGQPGRRQFRRATRQADRQVVPGHRPAGADQQLSDLHDGLRFALPQHPFA